MRTKRATIGTVVRFRDDFSKSLRGKRFMIVNIVSVSEADNGRLYTIVKRLDVKRPWHRLAWVDQLVECD